MTTTRCPHRRVTKHFGRSLTGPYVRYQCDACFAIVKPAAYVIEEQPLADELELMDLAARAARRAGE